MADRGGYLDNFYPHYHDVNILGSHPSTFSYANQNDTDAMALQELERFKNNLRGQITEREKEAEALLAQAASTQQIVLTLKSRLKALEDKAG